MRLIIMIMIVMWGAGIAPASTLEEVKDSVAVILDADLSEINIELVDGLGGRAIGVACGPALVLLDREYWDNANEEHKLLLVLHEVLHTYGVLHSTDMTNFFYRGNYLYVPRSVMFPSTYIFAPSLLEITMEHYLMEAKHAKPLGNRRNFMMPWIFTYNKRSCMDYLNSGSSHILDIL